jgi:hypothetical protein
LNCPEQPRLHCALVLKAHTRYPGSCLQTWTTARMATNPPQDDRKARLGAALRENLQRRKAQGRERRQAFTASVAIADPHSHDRVSTDPAQPVRPPDKPRG